MKAAVDILKEQVLQKKNEVVKQEETRGIKGDQAKVYMSEYNQVYVIFCFEHLFS